MSSLPQYPADIPGHITDQQAADRSSGSGVRASVLQPQTLLDFTSVRLTRLCETAGLQEDAAGILGTFRELVSPWASQRIVGAPSQWASDISDDNTPIELSVAIAEARVDVRVLFEAQAADPTLSAYRRAALEFHERLEREFGADLGRYRKIVDLFAPEGMGGPFAIWNSAVFSRGAPTAFKSYFNPQAHGPSEASALVEAALGRLGFKNAWTTLSRTAARRGPHLDELKYFALDLADDRRARVKVYVRHHDATPDDLEAACSGQRDYVPGEGLAFTRAMRGGDERLSARATFTCSAFVEGDDERPSATTLYVPVCAYAETDAAVRERVLRYLVEQNIAPQAYDRIVRGYTNRPLEDGVGMQSWMALQRHGGQPRVTVYLATEASKVFAPGTVPAASPSRTLFTSVQEVLSCVEQYPLLDHPLFGRLGRSEGDGTAVLVGLARVLDRGWQEVLAWMDRAGERITQPELHRLLEEMQARETTPEHTERVSRAVRGIHEVSGPPSGAVLSRAEGLGQGLLESLARHCSAGSPAEAIAALAVGLELRLHLETAIVELSGSTSEPSDEPSTHRTGGGTATILTMNPLTTWTMIELVAPGGSTSDRIMDVRRGVFGVHHALWTVLNEIYADCYLSDEEAPSTARASIPPSPFDDF